MWWEAYVCVRKNRRPPRLRASINDCQVLAEQGKRQRKNIAYLIGVCGSRLTLSKELTQHHSLEATPGGGKVPKRPKNARMQMGIELVKVSRSTSSAKELVLSPTPQ